jgi:hypothetical protein
MTVTEPPSAWRSRLRRDVAWSLFIKLGLLTLLWGLFFSSSHRCRVDGSSTANRFALTVFRADSHAGTDDSGGDRCD